MNYKGFSILHDQSRGWYVKVSSHEEWLASDKKDAMRQVDRYISRQMAIAA